MQLNAVGCSLPYDDIWHRGFWRMRKQSLQRGWMSLQMPGKASSLAQLQAQPTTHSQSLFREAPSSSMQCKHLLFTAVHWCFSVKHTKVALHCIDLAKRCKPPISCFLLPIFGHAGLRTLCLSMKTATLLKCPTNTVHLWIMGGKHNNFFFKFISMLHSSDVFGK